MTSRKNQRKEKDISINSTTSPVEVLCRRNGSIVVVVVLVLRTKVSLYIRIVLKQSDHDSR